MRPIPLRGRELALSDALFAGDALCFLDPASRSLRFEQSGGAAIEMDFHGFDHVALWTRPGAPFLCLEAWTGYSDPEGFAGDLFEKPSMRACRRRAGAAWRKLPIFLRALRRRRFASRSVDSRVEAGALVAAPLRASSAAPRVRR